MRRRCLWLCTLFLISTLTGCRSIESGSITIYDTTQAVIAVPNKMEYDVSCLTHATYDTYVSVVMNEAVDIFRSLYGINTEQAQNKLLKNDYQIYTAFDPVVHAAVDNMCAQTNVSEVGFGCAVTDLEGRLCAVYSAGDAHYATIPESPHSAFKPLSVYAPAMEKGLINWSTGIVDRPYHESTDDNSQITDWPQNPNGRYTYESTPLYDCIRQSLNTTAVHALAQLGVDTSVLFLQNTFGIDLSYEQNKLSVQGPDEVIGNIALGSLYHGVTPVDMAGYYQIFGNGGQYTQPHTIHEIRDKDGQVIYTYSGTATQALSQETAYLMNRLLKGVVSGTGTGADAATPTVEVVGKTGTGSYSESNWFVGVTPQYSCAVWHGAADKNTAAAMFRLIIDEIPHEQTKFDDCSNVTSGVFCSDSGMLSNSDCPSISIGYYIADQKPEVCDRHRQ